MQPSCDRSSPAAHDKTLNVLTGLPLARRTLVLGRLFGCGLFASIDISISFWPEAALRFQLFGAAASVARLCFSADIRSMTFVPVGRGLCPMVFPARFALISSVKASS